MRNEHVYFKGTTNKAVVFFHGYGADMHDLAPLQRILDPQSKCHWYFPNGPERISFNAMAEGRAWFPIDMQELERAMRLGTHREFADKSPQEFQQSLKISEEEIKLLQTKFDEVILGGFSQGAMMASHLANKLAVRALVVLSGTLLDKNSLSETYHDQKIPFFQSHGDVDQLLSLKQAKDLYELLESKGWSGIWAPFRGGHEIPPQVMQSLQHFLQQFF
jgi:phospholipase/carboxylesterase